MLAGSIYCRCFQPLWLCSCTSPVCWVVMGTTQKKTNKNVKFGKSINVILYVECESSLLHLNSAEVPEEEELGATEEGSDLFIASFSSWEKKVEGRRHSAKLWSPQSTRHFGAPFCHRPSCSFLFFFFLPPSIECVHTCVQPISPSQCCIRSTFICAGLERRCLKRCCLNRREACSGTAGSD